MFAASFSEGGAAELRDAADLSSSDESDTDQQEGDSQFVIDEALNKSIISGITNDISNPNEVALAPERSIIAQNPKIPPVPPRKKVVELTLPLQNPDETPIWYLVFSPREIKGVGGPFSITQLRKMYKYQEFGDSTLLWRDGQRNWTQLSYLHSLRNQLLQLPTIPSRITTVDPLSDKNIFNPIPELPDKEQISTMKPLYDWSMSKYCGRCGSQAVGYSGKGEPIPDLYELRTDFGATAAASEIIPSLLFIGGKSSSKNTSIASLKVTLIINVTNNLKNPKERLPYFRCRQVPMAEDFIASNAEQEQSIIVETIDILEKLYDMIEYERLLPERAIESDPLPPYYRGKTDKFGRPTEKVLPPRRIEKGVKEHYTSRVLVYSQNGNNRPALVAASFLIKHYGISKQTALDILLKNRPSSKLTPIYEKVLDEWGRMYSMGEMLCVDCAAGKPSIEEKTNDLIDPKLVTTYSQLNQLFLSTSGKDNPIIESLKSLGKPSDSYLRQVFTGDKLIDEQSTQKDISSTGRLLHKDYNTLTINTKINTYSHIMDLTISGRRLGDDVIKYMFQAFASLGITKHLRILDLRDNNIQPSGMRNILRALMYKDESKEKSKNSDSVNKWVNSEVLVLNLNNNYIGLDDDTAVEALTQFIKGHRNITSLDISNNAISDKAASVFFEGIAKSFTDFADDFDEEEDDDDDVSIASNSTQGSIQSISSVTSKRKKAEERKKERLKKIETQKKKIAASGSQYNRTLTHLDVSSNLLGPIASGKLEDYIRANQTLTSLRIDENPNIPPKCLRNMMNSMRIYNFTLERFSLADSQLTVKSTSSVIRMFNSPNTPLNTLILTRCELTSLHVAPFDKWGKDSLYLTYLDISCNPIGDTGAEYLATAIRGKFDSYNGKHTPPLKRLDISCCGIEWPGCRSIIMATSTRPCIKYLDISDNNMTTSPHEEGFIYFKRDEEFTRAFSSCCYEEFHANRCHLGTDGAIEIFKLLTEVTSEINTSLTERIPPTFTTIGSTLKVLTLSGNDIHDPASSYLRHFVTTNHTLQVLDLGFNAFTDKSKNDFSRAVQVTINSIPEMKLCSLHINMIGNSCYQYILGTPGLAKSKISFQFGTTGRDDYNMEGSSCNNLEHVSELSRSHYELRKKHYNKYNNAVAFIENFNYVK